MQRPALRGSTRPALILPIALLMALPLLLPGVQGLIDLPAHMAQFHVRDTIDRSASVARFYAYQWRWLPNLGVDLLVEPLGRLVGVELATRIIVACIPALTALGVLLVAREAHRDLPSTSLFAVPLAYAYPLTFGFVNSCLSVALALLAYAGWLWLTRAGRTRARLVFTLLAGPVLLVTHIMGWGVFGVLVAGTAFTLPSKSGSMPPSMVERALTIVRACLPIACALLLLGVWGHDNSGTTSGWLNFTAKGMSIVTIVRDRYRALDVVSAIILYVVSALPILLPRRFTYLVTLALPALLLWTAALILPTRIAGSEFASVRLIPVACALSILAVRSRQPTPPWLSYAAVAFIAIRLLANGIALHEADTRFDNELAALRYIAPGSRVVAFEEVPCRREWSPPRLQHVASFALVRRDAFVNDDFSGEAGQLMRHRFDTNASLAALSEANVIASRTCGRPWPTRTLADMLQTTAWPDANYLWLIDVPADHRPHDRRLRPIWSGGDSILYRLFTRQEDH